MKTHNVKNRISLLLGVINNNNSITTNGTHNVTKMNKHVNFNDNNYFTKKTEHNSNITNKVTRHKHNNYAHNVIKKVCKHITHINN